ncbi:MAG: S8 family serine peptidase [Leucobacter sp.]
MLGLAFAGAASAHAETLTSDERSAGLWYADRLKFDELQSQGATGEGIKIAVVDGGINLDAAELQGANIEVMGSYCAFPETGKPVPAVSDDLARAAHGTDVVSMLVGNGEAEDGGLGTRGIVPDAEIRFYASGMPEEESREDKPGCEEFDPSQGEFYSDKGFLPGDPDYFLGGASSYAAWHAVRDGADIVVFSGISDVWGWPIVVEEALRAGVPLVAGTPNPDGDLDNQISLAFPHSLNGVVAVSGVDNDGNVLNGGGGDDWLTGEAQGSDNLGVISAASAMLTPSSKDGWVPSIGYGTSLATPLVAGTIALGMEAHPDATANQILQTMIRTTGTSGLHEPEWHGKQLGYGVTNPVALLQTDPLVYADENPLFVMQVDDSRCIYADGTVPTEMENCAWAIAGPYADDVWPTGTNDSPPANSGAISSEGEDSSLLPIVLTIGGVFLLAVIATAISVPILVSRSRKRRLDESPPGAAESEAYRG